MRNASTHQDSIRTMTTKQLCRIYSRLYVRLGDGGLYGWDLPTIAMCFPAIYASIRRLIDESKRRQDLKTMAIPAEKTNAHCKVPGCRELGTFAPYDFAPNVRFCDRHAAKLIVATVRRVLTAPCTTNQEESHEHAASH